MKIAFLGTSHAARHLSQAAAHKGFWLSRTVDADLIFVSEDTPTSPSGERDMEPIRDLVREACLCGVPVVLTSQVEPGFTRSLGVRIYHQAETLRIRDAYERARNPEMLIVGCEQQHDPIDAAYSKYLNAFRCPILQMTWEDAEFAKIAINATLISQVENTNRLSAAAERFGARWETVANVLRHDSRIGRDAYLTPGRWQDSPHLLRDFVTLTK